MIEQSKLRWFYGLTATFVVLNTLFVFLEFFWFNVIPVALVFVGLAFFSLDKLLLIITFATPFSINLEEYLEAVGLGLFVPTEPLLFGILIITIFRFLYEGNYDKKILKHPVTIAIIVNTAWLFITSITSQEPLVSFKFLLARLWFIVAFYFLAVHLFKKETNITRFIWLYIISFSVVIIYTVGRHYTYGFADKPAHFVMQPFYKDHTSYGAMLAMFYPLIIGSLFSKKINFNAKFLISLVAVIFTVGLIFSYTRAAWVSLVAAFGVGMLFWFKIKFKTVAATGLLAIILFFSFQDQILMSLKKNKQDSSEDLAEHVQSISNVASDASNLERINRWNCAFSMFMEKPVLGWGPGTYAFFYAPFQQSGDITIISTDFGDKGNAHSEYFGPLAEAGLFGSLSFIFIVGLVIYKASMLIITLKNRELKMLVLMLLLGLITYFVHGALNNYLDTDKAAIPFWGMIAAIVAIDIYHKKPKLNH